MKKILFVVCLFSSVAAFAQYNPGANNFNGEALVSQFNGHPAHAGYVPMSQEQSVLPGNTYLSAQGERRPSDFAQPDQLSLGAVARELRKQHAEVKKSRVVWIN